MAVHLQAEINLAVQPVFSTHYLGGSTLDRVMIIILTYLCF